MLLSDLDRSKSYTYADYYQWDFDERVELIKGELFEMGPSPGTLHQRILMRFVVEIGTYLKKESPEIFMAPFDVRLPTTSTADEHITTVVQPDICVVCDPDKIDERGCIGTPDLIIEILSPGNNSKELRNKYEIYEEAGVLEYWIVLPTEKTFFRYLLRNGRFEPTRLLTLSDDVTTPILPGFTMELNEIFLDW